MHMSCDEVQRVIPWLLDDELDAEQSLEIEQHLGSCSVCRSALEREGHLRLALRRAAASVAVPVSLKNRLRETMERERRLQSRWSKAWPAAIAVAILLAFLWKGTSGNLASDLDDLATRHARLDLPMDIVAADAAGLQSYFSGKLPFAVRLPRLDPQDPPNMIGGRIVQLGGREAAYVRFDTPHGRMSLLVYEDGYRTGVSEVAPLYKLGEHQVMVKHVRGYTAARWRSSGLVYAVVTDLSEAEFTVILHQSMQ